MCTVEGVHFLNLKLRVQENDIPGRFFYYFIQVRLVQQADLHQCLAACSKLLQKGVAISDMCRCASACQTGDEMESGKLRKEC
jgi:hypothetical protein